MDDHAGGGVPQFSTAEYSNSTAESACKSCRHEISGSYYRVNGARTCTSCTQRVQDQLPKDSHASFARGFAFGIGAALLGLIIYVVFALTTGLMIGYVSLAVGFIVGKAIMMGSRGIGGRRYQMAAVLLTYAAVSLAAVPIAISQYSKHKQEQHQTQAQDPAAAAKPKPSPAKALAVLTLIGLASPFLELSNPMSGIIGLIILFVGINIAWKITAAKPVDILGPITDHVPGTVI